MRLPRANAHFARLRREGREAQAGFWWTLIFLVISVVASELLRPKPQLEDAKPAGLGDFQFPTATEGRIVPLLWGTVQIKGANVAWWGDLVQEAITEKVKTGLFSSETITKGYRYKLGIQDCLCLGPVDEFLRFWVGDEEVFNGALTDGQTFTVDEPELFGGDELGNGGYLGTWKFHAGGLSQAVDPYLAGFQQIGPNNRTPAYRGVSYLCPSSEPIYIGNSTSPKPHKYEVKRLANLLALGTPGVNSNLDANPANVIYEVLTNTVWGLGISPGKIDAANFIAVSTILRTEGNGFSWIMDSAREASEVIALLEEQIDGLVYWDQANRVFKIKIIRADYDPNTVPELNASTVLKVSSFSRGSWESTTNEVRTQFFDRADNYKQTYGLAQDSANIRIRAGVVSSSTKVYPGVKTAQLASDLAWRDLRGLSHPLARLVCTVDRTFWDVTPGTPYVFTSAKLGITRLPMRVTKINYGDPSNEEIRIELVQDVFYFQAASFGNTGGSGWTPPVDVLVPFPGGEQLAFESPRAINFRDPKSGVGADNRVWLTARRQGVEVTYKVMKKLAAESVYTEIEESVGFVKIGELQSLLTTSGNAPQASIIIVPTPDSQADIRSLFDSAPALPELGINLLGLILVGNEFMLVSDASNSGGNVNLENVYRGVLDSTRTTHAAGADVFMMVAGGVTAGPFGELDDLDFKLLPRSRTDIVDIASAVNMDVVMNRRSRRPYPPGEIRSPSTQWPTSVSLEQDAGGAEVTGYTWNWDRRDYRTAEGGDEIAALTVDAATLFGDFPTANNTLYDVEIWDDPAGTPTLLLTFSNINGTSRDVNRLAILQATGGALPTRMRVIIKTKHDDNGLTLFSRYNVQHDFDVTSALTGFFEFGALDTAVSSASYTADAAGQHDFTLSSAFTLGAVEYRIDTGGGFGAWLPLIAAGLTTGNIPGVGVGDIIQVRHQSTDVGALKQLTLTAPGAGTDGFAVLYV